MIKDVLAIVDNAEQSAPFVHAVLEFARVQGAHVAIAALTGGPYIAQGLLPLGGAYVPDETLACDSEQKVNALCDQVAASSCAVSVFGLHDDIAWLAGDLRRSRQIADLILIGAPEYWQNPWLRERVIETCILSSGTPTLLMPLESRLATVRRAVLGWKPSPEAIRAVHDLVQVCEPGAHIDIVIATQGGQGGAERDGHEVQRHLLRHGFDVAVHVIANDGRDDAEVVRGFAMRAQADLLAVGGFGHTRIREVILGGVTRELVRDAAVAVMLSH
jgi:nucleotide-binding universal stress UspA family protein